MLSFKSEKLIFPIYKFEGETPLQAINRFKNSFPEFKDLKMTYAGRLDPMAYGLLIILGGDLVKEKEKYLGLDKEYSFEILLGFNTDTFDLLGKIEKRPEYEIEIKKIDKTNHKVFFEHFKKMVNKIAEEKKMGYMQEYPKYSSKTVSGKPLFSLARAEKEVILPSKFVSIKNLSVDSYQVIEKDVLYKKIEIGIKKVDGDFRQDEILNLWKNTINNTKTDKYLIIKLKAECSSGTYIRALVNEFSEKINLPMCTFSILRTRVGQWKLKFI